MPSRVVRAVLFDLDGTLVDNMPYHIAAWIETARGLGRSLTSEQVMRDFGGRRNDEILPMLLGRPLTRAEIEPLSAQKEQLYRALYAPHVALIQGADAFLSFLAARAIQCAIASSAPPENRSFVLDALALWPRMAAVVGAEEVARGKPAPDLFLEAARRLEVSPEQTLVFEDAVLGVQAARAAGMRVCGITTSESADTLAEAGALASSASFRDLSPEVLGLFG